MKSGLLALRPGLCLNFHMRVLHEIKYVTPSVTHFTARSCSIILEDPYVYKPTLAWKPTAHWEVTVEALESVAWRGQT